MNIDKASLGTRYLINYINSKNPAHLDVVRNCTKDIAFWAMLMHFCNNMNELFDALSEPILERIFTQKRVVKVVDVLSDATEEYTYGLGYTSNTKGKYKNHIRNIRNALAHGTFEFDGTQIHISTPNSYVATFDYEWFKSLVLSTLSNENFQIKRGIEDYSIIKLTEGNDKNYKASDIKNLEQLGLIKLIKLTCKATDATVISTKFPGLAKKEGKITFDDLKIIFIRLLSELSSKVGFTKALEKLKRAYKGIIDIEALDIKSDALNDPEFLNLPLESGIDYLVNEISSKDKNTKSTINLKRILNLLDKLNEDAPLTPSEEYALKDTLEFLLNLYGYIYFNQFSSKKKDDDSLAPFYEKIEFKIVHAKNVWGEYIKKISKSIDCLVAANASEKRIDMWKERLRIYKLRLEKMLEDDNNILRLLRNSITHGLVEHSDNLIVFYGEEPTLTLPKINSKTKELTEYTFQNKGRTFEIDMDKDTYLSLLDNLYEASGIEIKVNISKYRKRKNYLSN